MSENDRLHGPSGQSSLTREDREQVDERLRPRAAVIYEIVRREGEEELTRTVMALFWSGLAAGLSIGFSMVTEGLLHAYLPDEPWRPIIENFGYCVGFLIVVLGRQQLFTENTITAVLPVMASLRRRNLVAMLRLWGVVFAANMVGCLIFAAGAAYGGVFSADASAGLATVAHHLLENSWTEMLTKGVAAGWLIAAMVWLLPNAEGGAKFFVIVLATYVIALGDFTHIIAGAVEAFYLAFLGQEDWGHVLGGFLVPTFIGNVLGGSALFALISYAQVHDEI